MSRGGRWRLVVIGLLALEAGRSGADETTPLPDSKSRPDSIVFAGIPWRTPRASLPSPLALGKRNFSTACWRRPYFACISATASS